MPSIKITALTTLTTPSANAENTVFVVVDKSSGTPTTKQLSLQNLDLFVDNVGSVAFAQANGAFAQANTANTTADASFSKANSANVLAQNAYNFANTITSAAGAFSHANGAFGFANTTANLVLTFSATTVLDVSANGSIAYVFSQHTGLNNPNVSTFSATTLGFNLTPLAGSHPFHIRLGNNSADFNTGLVHISTTGTLSYESAAQGKTSGTLLWRIPHTSVGNYKYRCSAHPGAMIGNINVANTANIYFAYSS